MKKIMFAIAALLVSVLCVSCSESLEGFVERVKKELPAEMGKGQVMTDVALEGDFLKFVIEEEEADIRLDEPAFDMVLSMLSESLKKDFIGSADGDMKKLLEKCVEEGKGIKFVMNGKQSKKSITLLEVNAEDLKNELPK